MFLNCNDINFSYREAKEVLNGISFSLDKADTLAIVGASGCGKSTLLRIVSGILPNSRSNRLQGTVTIDNLMADEYRQTDKLAFMFQEATLMPHLTVTENIALPLKIKGIQNNAKVENLINAVGLENAADYLPKQLSGGMKTRVALARAFVNEPELLLLDEPFSALDIGWKSDLYEKLETLKNEYHTTVIIVTHDVQEAILLSDKILVLNRAGSLQADFIVDTTIDSSKRVENIPEFLRSNAFQELYPLLQQAIILEDERKNIKENKAENIVKKIQESAGDADKEKQIDNYFLDPIREYSNDIEVHSVLANAFEKAKTNRFKYMLLWDILEYNNLSDISHTEYSEYYLNNIEEFSTLSREWYKLHTDERFFDILTGRIRVLKGYNQRKKWIYICDLYAVSNLPVLIPFLNEIIEGKISEVNFPLAKLVAQKVQTKIKNEKTGSVHIA